MSLLDKIISGEMKADKIAGIAPPVDPLEAIKHHLIAAIVWPAARANAEKCAQQAYFLLPPHLRTAAHIVLAWYQERIGSKTLVFDAPTTAQAGVSVPVEALIEAAAGVPMLHRAVGIWNSWVAAAAARLTIRLRS